MKILKLISLVLLSAVPLSLISCGNSGEEGIEAPDFEMTAKVKELGEKILVEVIEDEYNSGDFLVIYSDETVFTIFMEKLSRIAIFPQEIR